MPLYPSKVLRAKMRAPTPYSFVVFCLGLTFESLKELGVHHLLHKLTSVNGLQHQRLTIKKLLKQPIFKDMMPNVVVNSK